MGKHRLQRESNVGRTMRGAAVVGAVGAATVGGAAISAVPASAATITVPGIGNFEVPDLPALPQFQVPPLPPELNALPVPSVPSVAVPMNATVGQRALDAARTKLGASYVWGATGPNAFDCSGLVQWSYQQVGIALPRTTYEQANVGAPVAFQNLQPGDIVLMNGGGHDGIYAGNGQILHASTESAPVQYGLLSSQTFVAARRI